MSPHRRLSFISVLLVGLIGAAATLHVNAQVKPVYSLVLKKFPKKLKLGTTSKDENQLSLATRKILMKEQFSHLNPKMQILSYRS